LKLKFLKLNKDDEDDKRLAIRFNKKAGSLADQKDLMNELMTFLEEIIIDEEELE
jgi:hypothetical protein